MLSSNNFVNYKESSDPRAQVAPQGSSELKVMILFSVGREDFFKTPCPDFDDWLSVHRYLLE